MLYYSVVDKESKTQNNVLLMMVPLKDSMVNDRDQDEWLIVK